MLSRGDAVVYKCRGLYEVEDIGTLDFSFVDSSRKYYTLRSVEDARDRAYVPADDAANIRRPVSREEALELIGRIPQIETLEVKNEKTREQEYKACIADFCPENWVRVLKTTYKRTKSRGSVTSLDRKYQMLLEHALYSEFSYALGIPAEEIGQFIAEHTERAEK
ncbi:MAG TPA: CarD family transcriptional regulator [Candidatus Mediterraneibacter merdipullorum]|nr:CarD family transcriptional regulator [Candidatus Mediterraneibacter merdipullorum]